MKTCKLGEKGQGMTIFNTKLLFSSCSGADSSVSHDIRAGLEEAQVQYPRKASKHIRCASPGLCCEVQRGEQLIFRGAVKSS